MGYDRCAIVFVMSHLKNRSPPNGFSELGNVGAMCEAQVEARPGAVAVLRGPWDFPCRTCRMLAHRIKPTPSIIVSRVGACLPRSHESVIAVLACLKAGAAYAPLDPVTRARPGKYPLRTTGA